MLSGLLIGYEVGLIFAAYGQQSVHGLDGQLNEEYGPGSGHANLLNMIRLAKNFPDRRIVHALSEQLSWTHLSQVIHREGPTQREFYTQIYRIERWSTGTHGEVYRRVLNELHGSPANPDVQTASNLDLAKVRNGKVIQFLSQESACDVFELTRDDERVKEEIGFRNPEGQSPVPEISELIRGLRCLTCRRLKCEPDAPSDP